MAAILSIFWGLCAFLKKRSPIIALIGTALILSLATGALNIADTQVYINRFSNIEQFDSFTEPLFTAMLLSFKNAGLDFNTFFIVVNVLIISIKIYILSRLTKDLNFVLMLYCIFPLCLDVCWLRMSCGVTIIYVGMYYWLKLKKTNRIRGLVVISASILIASGFHAGLLFYFLIPIADYISVHMSYVIAIVMSFIGITLTRSNTLYSLISQIVSEGKAEIIASTSSYGTLSQWLIYTLGSVILLFTVVQISFLSVKKHLFFKGYQDDAIGKIELTKGEYIDFFRKVNILLLSLMSIIPYSGSFYRLQIYMLPFMYVGFSFYFEPQDRYIYKKELAYTLKILLLLLIVLYVFVGHTSIWESTFVPFFMNNANF
ncbi:hypothetical protein E4K24_000363 [Enterococcus faecium]|nr:hypothetical protein [Enterococcus faecium]